MASRKLIFLIATLILFCACSIISFDAKNTETDSPKGGSVSSTTTLPGEKLYSVESSDDMMELFCQFIESGGNDYELSGGTPMDRGLNKVEALNLKSVEDEKTTAELLAMEYVYYVKSPFYLSRVVTPIEIEKIINQTGNIDSYTAEFVITLDVTESKSPFLKTGPQKWYISMGLPMDGNDFATPCGYWEHEKYLSQSAILKTIDKELLAQFERLLILSSNVDRKRPFDTVESWSIDELVLYSARSCNEKILENKYSVSDVEAMITKVFQIVPPSLKESIFYCDDNEDHPVIYFDEDKIGATSMQRYMLWKTEIIGEKAYLWYDIMNPEGEGPSKFIYPAESMCASFDIGGEIPKPIKVSELIAADSCSFYLNREVKIPAGM